MAVDGPEEVVDMGPLKWGEAGPGECGLGMRLGLHRGEAGRVGGGSGPPCPVVHSFG